MLTLLAGPSVVWEPLFGSWVLLQLERINVFAILRAVLYSASAMGAEFQYDVFLSHSAKDKAVVRGLSLFASNGERAGVRCRNLHLSERLRTCRSEAAGRRQKDGLEPNSAFSVLPFRKGSLAQFLYINWLPALREQESFRARQTCLPLAVNTTLNPTVVL
ncbi:MAG: hypothetical protein NT154_18300 [Verrucomicrobia bacterium]|nr:hypothetical protein [Verrucomicrobiota bacterium]